VVDFLPLILEIEKLALSWRLILISSGKSGKENSKNTDRQKVLLANKLLEQA
jgi:hypothetical protein